MADHSITISNNVLFVGYNPTETWGALTWGTDNWRFSGDVVQDVTKPIDFGSVTLADEPIKDIEHLNDMGSTLLSDKITKALGHQITDQVLMAYEIVTAYLTDENGYNYVFIGDVIDADDRKDATWSAVSSTSSTWTPVASASAIWS